MSNEKYLNDMKVQYLPEKNLMMNKRIQINPLINKIILL